MGFANFHIHTYFSDGMTGPTDLAQSVYAEADLEFFTITDHFDYFDIILDRFDLTNIILFSILPST